MFEINKNRGAKKILYFLKQIFPMVKIGANINYEGIILQFENMLVSEFFGRKCFKTYEDFIFMVNDVLYIKFCAEE